MMDPVIDAEGDETYAYNQEKLSKLLEHKPLENEVMKEYRVPGLNGAPDVPCFLFETTDTAPKTPVVFMIHGGGFTGGAIPYDYNRLSYYTQKVGCRVFSPDYRRIEYPNSLEDCYASLLWMYENADSLGIDGNKIALCGSSAGATLALALSLYVRDKGGPQISCQILMNPVITSLGETVSAQQFYKKNWMLNGADLPNQLDRYLKNLDGGPIPYYAMPGNLQKFNNIPPTVMACGEYDPMRDEITHFALRLMDHRVPTELYVLPRVPHSFDLCTEGCMTEWLWEAFGRALKREWGMM